MDLAFYPMINLNRYSSKQWVTQTKFYDPSKPPDICTGNCTEAALASVFRIPLEKVPSFQGLATREYWDAVYAFIESFGYDFAMLPPDTKIEGLYLADGPSPRGCGHFVVMYNGKMVHDPHPSRAGLLSIDHVWEFKPIQKMY